MNIEERAAAAAELKATGKCNCTQSVVKVFEDKLPISVETLMKLTITCNYNVQAALFLAFGQIWATELRIRSRNIKQRGIKRFEIGTAVFHPFLGAPQLAGRYQLHGFGNLHGAFHAFDAQFDFFHGTSHRQHPLWRIL